VSYSKVSIIGAGNVGASAGLLIALKNLADVVMLSTTSQQARGKALDIMHMRSIERFGPTVIGTDNYADTANSSIIVITAGAVAQPGMSREDLLDLNAEVVRSVVRQAIEFSPDAVIVTVTNPLDVMTNFACEISGLPPERVLGMGGVLDTARFVHAIADATGATLSDIDAMAIGAHGPTMVPLPRQATVANKPLNQILDAGQIEQLITDTVDGGGYVIQHLGRSAYHAPGAAITLMVEELLKSTGRILSACVHSQGHYGLPNLHIGLPAKLDKNGVAEVVEFDLDAQEHAALKAAAESIDSQYQALKNGLGI
jgi:malate dehydrogenase